MAALRAAKRMATAREARPESPYYLLLSCSDRSRYALRMLRSIAACSLLLLASCASRDVWPQAAGPHANWIVPEAAAPTAWSVARNENILWKCPLPNSGQGGIAIAGDRLYLATFAEQDPSKPRQSNAKIGRAHV